MTTKPFCFFQIIRALKIATVALFFLVLCVIITLLFLTLNAQREEKGLEGKKVLDFKNHDTKNQEPLNFEEFEFSKTFESFYEKDLSKTLLFLGINSRPDAKQDQTKILLGFKNSKQSCLVDPGEKLYLSYEKGDLVFSRETTPLWIKIKGVENEILSFDAAFVLTNDETNDVFQEKMHYENALEFQEEFEDELTQSTYFQSFEEAKWWHPDLFYEIYGGEEFEANKGSQRLEFVSQSPSICFIKPENTLIFKENAWFLSDSKNVTQEYPMAQILEVTPGHMEVKIWDVSGMHSKVISLLPQRVRPLNLKAEEIFSKILQRTSTQVSCKIGSKNALLKKGEWLLRVGGHWKPLKTWEEIEKYLSFELQGELFVFDGIEKNQGIAVFKGHLFDTMREQMQVVRIPLTRQKKSSAKRKKHKELSDLQESAVLSDDSTSRVEEQDKDALLRLTTPQKRHEFSKQM